jgi:VanZ family protein
MKLTEKVPAYTWLLRLVFTTTSVAWMGLIYYLSSRPPDQIPGVDMFSGLGELRDTLGHAAIYLVLGVVMLGCAWSWADQRRYQLRWTILPLALGAAYGLLDELHQSLVPGRSASALDVLTDSAGVITGVLLASRAARRLAKV